MLTSRPIRWMACSLILLSLTLISGPAFAQETVYSTVYRPSDVRYEVLRSPHFDIIYQVGSRHEAVETAHVLEREVPPIKNIFELDTFRRMPVVLNRFNDDSNGYVTPVPFKQEIELVALKGNGLSPRHTSWLSVVAPHELVHAMQAEYRAGFGFGALLRPFAPDFARALNFGVPPGLTEGIAVVHESRVEEGAGRLNHPLFLMQFRAAMGSDRPWSLAQMLEAPAYARPFNRFYIGGSHFVEHLLASYGEDAFARMLGPNQRYVAGAGVGLWNATGKRPSKLGRAFRDEVIRMESERVANLGTLTMPEVISHRQGTMHRRPLWLDDQTIVAYSFGYNLRAGLYTYDAATGKRSLLKNQLVTEDRAYSLDRNAGQLLLSQYVADRLVSIKERALLHAIDTSTKHTTTLKAPARLLAPVRAPNGNLWAFENDGPFNHWVEVTADGSSRRLTNFARSNFAQIAPSPTGQDIGVLLNVQGFKGVFRAQINGGETTLEPWIGFKDATIYDLSWSADGQYLFFSADVDGVANIYTLDVSTDQIYQITNVPYGAIEGTLSPDGRWLAYVNYTHEQYDLARIPFDISLAKAISRAGTNYGATIPWAEQLNEPPTALPDTFETMPYQALRHIKPRMAYPYVVVADETGQPFDTELGVGVGLEVQGADPLESFAYRGRGFVQDGDVWGNIRVESGALAVRPSLSLYRTPTTVVARTLRESADPAMPDTVIARFGRAEQGAEVGFRLPIQIIDNVFSSGLTLGLRAGYETERLFNDALAIDSDLGGRFTVRPSLALFHRIRSNARDFVPNNGITLSVGALADVASDENQFERQAIIGTGNLYLPWLRRANIGLRLRASVLSQNTGGIYNLDAFLPRGWEDTFVGSGTTLVGGFEATLPLAYIDDGVVLFPAYLKALYAYSFAETFAQTDAFDAARHSVGAGLGVQFRIFSVVDIDMRVGAALRISDAGNEWDVIFR